MEPNNDNQKKTIFITLSNTIYTIVEKIPFVNKGVRKGGILLKWTVLISIVAVFIVFILSFSFTLMSTNSIKTSTRNLCKTIAGNISASSKVITNERTAFKRSLTLQDIIGGISESKIPGFEYAAVYDFKGIVVERKNAYAAHSNTWKRARRIPRDILKELVKVKDLKEERVVITKKVDNQEVQVPCYQYRMPFKLFKDQPSIGVIEVVFNEESILGPVNRMRLWIILIGIGIIICGIGISIFTVRGMVRPINKLSDGMNSVRAGNLDVHLEIRRHDELGDLGEEFNNLISHLREKLQMQKFVSDSTISMIKEGSKKGDISLGGTRENFVFLFSDIRGFTAMSEKLKPEQVVSVLNTYLDLQAQIIKNNNGDIDKFVGDEVMAVFSGPKKTDHAFTAAVEIIEAIKKLNTERIKENKITIEVGIGLHMGDVVHGRMGSRDRMDNTSIGDAVNLSARLCSQAEPGVILASKDILATATKGKFTGKKLEPVRVKGKAKPIQIYSITGIKKQK